MMHAAVHMSPSSTMYQIIKYKSTLFLHCLFVATVASETYCMCTIELNYKEVREQVAIVSCSETDKTKPSTRPSPHDVIGQPELLVIRSVSCFSLSNHSDIFKLFLSAFTAWYYGANHAQSGHFNVEALARNQWIFLQANTCFRRKINHANEVYPERHL